MTGSTFQTFGLWPAMSLLLFAAAVSATGQAQPEADNGQPLASQPSEWIRTISVPLEQGEFSLGSVLGELFDQVGLDGQVARENIHLDFDVAGTAWGEKEKPYGPATGATGNVIRLVLDLIEAQLVGVDAVLQAHADRAGADLVKQHQRG